MAVTPFGMPLTIPCRVLRHGPRKRCGGCGALFARPCSEPQDFYGPRGVVLGSGSIICRAMNTESPSPLRIVLVRDRDDMGAAILATLEELGYAPRVEFRHRLPQGFRFDPQDVDVVLAYGPHNGSILEAANTVDFRRHSRPLFVWWLLENLPSSGVSPAVLNVAGECRLWLDALLRVWSGRAIAAGAGKLQHLLESGHRMRIWAEARRLHNRRQLDGFYVDSAIATKILARDGVHSVHLPFGGHQVFGRDLGIPRDLDVVFLGQPGSKRRLRLLERTKIELARGGVDVHVVDGTGGYLDGDARTRLLNRSKVVLNIMKEAEDSVGLRFLMAGANKAVTVSEPTSALTFLRPGEHYVEAPPEQLADAVMQSLRNENARTAMAERTFRYLMGEGHLVHSVQRILGDCHQRLAGIRSQSSAPVSSR